MDIKERFQRAFGQGAGKEQATPGKSNRANGGTSGYRPPVTNEPIRTADAPRMDRQGPNAFGGIMPEQMRGTAFQRVASTTGNVPRVNEEQAAAQSAPAQGRVLDRVKQGWSKVVGQVQQMQRGKQGDQQAPAGQNVSQQVQQARQEAQRQQAAPNPQAAGQNAGQRFTAAPQQPYQRQFGTAAQAQQNQQGRYGQPQYFAQGQNQQYAQAQPVQAQSAQMRFAQAQPVQAQPAQMRFAQAQPAQAQSVQAQPVQAQYAQAQPAQVQYAQVQPVQAAGGANYGYSAAVPPMPGPQQPESMNGAAYMNGLYVDQQQRTFRTTINVAQVTSVSSCYRLIEFLQNGECLLVNAECITDKLEADRCLDILYGAALVMQDCFTRVSGKTMYLITPPTVQLSAYDSIREMGQRDQMERWPDDEPFASLFGHQEDYVRSSRGQRRRPNNTGYTNYNGYME